MNGQTQEKIRTWIKITLLGIFFIGCMFWAIRDGMINPNLDYEEACSLEYGENWTYEDSSIFGRTCVEVDYETMKELNKVEIDWKIWEMEKKHCNTPRFFELDRWDYDCPKTK